MNYVYKYPRPSVTVDCIVFSPGAGSVDVLLVRRGQEPFAGMWALPGGFVDMDEELEAAAQRELREETGIGLSGLKQLFAAGAPGRDPRGRTISIVFGAVCDKREQTPVAGDDAAGAEWFSTSALPELAFDHRLLIHEALKRYKKRGSFRETSF